MDGSFTTSGLGLAYAYDNAGRLTSATDSTSGTARTLAHLHDPNGDRIRLTHPDGVYFDHDRLVTGEVSRIRENGATSGIGLLAVFTYDDRMRRKFLSRSNTAMTGYAYDPVSRLAELGLDAGGGTVHDLSLTFAYNPAGQIVTQGRSNDAYAWTGHHDQNTASTANGLNQLASIGGGTPAYDLNGNMTADGLGRSYAYDVENRLVSSTANGITTTLAYDPLGRLASIASGGVTKHFLHDGDALVAEYDGSGALLRRFVHGPGVDEPLVQYEGAGLTDRRFLHADHQGSIIGHSNFYGDGHVIALNAYDEYGNPQGTLAGRFGYTGQAWIEELGLYYYKSRFYHPVLPRFMQTDPLGYEDQRNLYAYVGNDPVNARDPSGQRIVLAAHEVVILGFNTGEYHLKLAIIPDNQDLYKNDSRFITNNAGSHVATIGAGPANYSIFRPLGDLVSDFNRTNDVNMHSIPLAEIKPGKGDSEDALIERIFAADANYNDGLQYQFDPSGTDGYNSNSYIIGLLHALGIDNVPLPNSEIIPTQGSEKPVPLSCFNDNKGC